MRQLAAILFADMTGYTALMQENEHLARNKRKRFKDVLEAAIEQHNGKILQYYGDGSLSIFNSAINSVDCAISIQQQLQIEPKVDLRIGIHTGDVVIEEESIYGDGVNLASRIESMAVPGAVFISGKVHDEIKNQKKIKTQELGFFELKNVKEPVRIYAIANDGIVVPSTAELKGKTKQPVNRLAVLPFVNMSADPENEYFSDGITEELLNALTRVDGLQVTSRTSAFAFKGKHDDIREIGRKLNVDKVLEGSVRKAGNRVRITAQLINAADGYHIWSENYDRDLHDIFQVQDEISGIIANKLRENLSVTEKKETLVKAPTKNLEAYTLFLKGMHFYNKLTPADYYKAIEFFEQAIQLEPNYAHAYAMIARTWAYLGITGQAQPEKAFDIVKRYSEKALRLDDTIAESHVAKATMHLMHDGNWQAGYDSLQTAIRLNPAATGAFEMLAIYHLLTGDIPQAVKVLEQASQIDPLSSQLNHSLADAYFFADRYDDAVRVADKLLEIDPQMRIAIEMKGWCAGMKGDWQTAKEYFNEVHRLTNHPLKGLAPLGFAYAKLGQTDKALEIISKIEQRQREEPNVVVDGDLLMVWWALGNMDKVVHYFEKGIAKRISAVNYFLNYPPVRGITDDPRIKKLLDDTRQLSAKT
ncbi:MAG TPA: tetratricopeptide repeat protein [Chitinophagaceae bacterium]|nr:tetratricopeptide repeat protein [Chitinophagaceae bacterium]